MRIGDYYNNGILRGVVISVDVTGRHGLIMSLTGCTCKWYTGSQDVRTQSRNQLDGMVNQNYIRNTYGFSQYPAFAYCANKGEGWYLPAIEELNSLTSKANFDAVERTLSIYGEKLFSGNYSAELYLSSTEGDTASYDTDHNMVLVLGVNSYGADVTSDLKRSSYTSVRAVHKF